MQTIEIKDLEAPELTVFSKLKEVQLYRYYEPEPGIFLAESANVTLRALEAGYEPLSMLAEKEKFDKECRPVLEKITEIYGKEKTESIPVYVADHEIVENLTGYALVKGLWTVFRRKKVQGLEEFCLGKKRLAVLYDVVNPTNVGAIIRSAAALGADGAVLTHTSVDPLTRRSSRVSMGTVFQIPWTVTGKEESRGTALIDRLHGMGFKTVAMALTENSYSVRDKEIKNSEKLAIILGNEGFGLPEEIINSCTYHVMIPMYNGVDSLNVAAASAVAFWELIGSEPVSFPRRIYRSGEHERSEDAGDDVGDTYIERKTYRRVKQIRGSDERVENKRNGGHPRELRLAGTHKVNKD